MSSWEDYQLTCVHGIREGVDSHECPQCQKLAKDHGLPPISTGYIFTVLPTDEEWKSIIKRSKKGK